MGIFTRLEARSDTLHKLHRALSVAFDHIRSDIHGLSQWNNYFHQKHLESDDRFISLNHRLSLIENSLSSAPTSPEEIKSIVDKYYSFDSVLSKVQELSSRLDDLEVKRSVSPSPSSSFSRSVVSSVPDRRVNIRDRIVQKISKNSKDYVKSTILSLINKYGSINGPQLKEMVVFEQGLCSKSSFYRMLQELEFGHHISVVHRGKEKNYLAKSTILQ